MSKNYIINNYELDDFQMELINSNNNSIVIAGAGAGKTLTILGKVKHLIENDKINPSEIALISFTNASTNDIKRKLDFNVNVFTFHKLAIEILKRNKLNYNICSDKLLSYITNEYLQTCNKTNQKLILKFLKINISYSQFLKSQQFLSFNKFITTFINLWKTNNYNYDNIKFVKLTKIEKKILTMIFSIYRNYIIEKSSTNSYDFDDLIIKAVQISFNFNFKYIIIDEFQDTSFIRLNLIKVLCKKNNSKIIVVGDDWQSIYRFSGCDLNIFINFNKYFNNVETIKLVNTYRNSQELINIASEFVMKNPKQIKKDLKSSIHSTSPLLFDPYIKKVDSLKAILNHLYTITNDIMILTRNNQDIYEYIDKDFILLNNELTYNNHSNKFYTVHKSKGLESEYVILLNCNNEILGFPNQIENHPLIDKIFSNNEIKFAEERRLFYVAITRCKKQTILMYDKNNPSIFIKEIKRIVKKQLGKIEYFK